MSNYENQDIPAGDVGDNDYASRSDQYQVPVQKDEAPVEDPIDANTADSDAQLGKLQLQTYSRLAEFSNMAPQLAMTMRLLTRETSCPTAREVRLRRLAPTSSLVMRRVCLVLRMEGAPFVSSRSCVQ